MTASSRMSRRNLLKALGYGSLVSVGGAAAGCSPPASDTPSEDPDSATGARGSTVTLATWPNYDDPELLERFAAETGIRVNVRVFGSTEEMEALLRAGNSGIDIAVPSQYAIPGWIESGLIRELNHERMELDLSAWNKAIVDQDFDPGNQFTVPKHWGTTGMICAPDVGQMPRTWKEYFEIAREVDRRAVIVDHQISSIGSAAVALGMDFNARDEASMREVEEFLKDLKSDLYGITSDIQPGLRNGETWMSIAWTGDGVQVVRDNPEFEYIIATDGGEIWSDNWSIAADAPNESGAYEFLKFIHQPDVAAQDIDFALYAHADPAVNELVNAEVRSNPVIYPDEATVAPLSFASSETYNSKLRADTWARIKSS